MIFKWCIDVFGNRKEKKKKRFFHIYWIKVNDVNKQSHRLKGTRRAKKYSFIKMILICFNKVAFGEEYLKISLQNNNQMRHRKEECDYLN